MPNWLRIVVFVLVLPLFAASALAEKAKGPSRNTAKSRGKSARKAAKNSPGVVKADMEARALVRKKAPFYLDQRFRGEIIRINKDGTFSREGELGAYNNQGSWRVNKGKIVMKWNTGEQFGYRLTFNGKTPMVAGQRASSSNHYVINSAD